ncbi:hypothetical protein SK128_014815, partial [Halocaridina rubra]
ALTKRIYKSYLEEFIYGHPEQKNPGVVIKKLPKALIKMNNRTNDRYYKYKFKNYLLKKVNNYLNR